MRCLMGARTSVMVKSSEYGTYVMHLYVHLVVVTMSMWSNVYLGLGHMVLISTLKKDVKIAKQEQVPGVLP